MPNCIVLYMNCAIQGVFGVVANPMSLRLVKLMMTQVCGQYNGQVSSMPKAVYYFTNVFFASHLWQQVVIDVSGIYITHCSYIIGKG